MAERRDKAAATKGSAAKATTGKQPVVKQSGGSTKAPKKSGAVRPAVPKAPVSLRPSGRKAGQTFDALVEATRSVVIESGSLSGDAVAEKAGMATATFYAYFSTKEDALGAAFESVVSKVNVDVEPLLGIERLLDHGLSVVLRDVLEVMLANFRENAAVFRLGLASLPDNERMRRIWRYHEHYAQQYISRFVHYGIASGQIRADDENATATILLVLLQGLNNHTLLRRGADDPVIDRMHAVLLQLLSP